MRKPQFFIVGAPKCGTTSVEHWIRGHPEIFMASKKEPHFFNVDGFRSTRDEEAYRALFGEAGPQHHAVGERSTWYLYSDEAVPRILDWADDPRFVACVRNPVEMAPSLHEQHVFNGDEHITDFREAWGVQAARRRGERLKDRCRASHRLVYGDVCRIGTQLQRLVKRAGRDRVLVLVLDELRDDPRGEYLRLLHFVGVEDDGRREFPVQNAGGRRRRSSLLRRALLSAGRLKRRLGVEGGTGILAWLDGKNRADDPRPELGAEMRAELVAHFEEDISRLEAVVGRTFPKWREIG